MFKDMDSQALMDSEIFRNFVSNIDQQDRSKELEKQAFKDKTLSDFEQLQIKINASPILKKEFKNLQERLRSNAALRESSNQDFVQGVLLLKLED